MNSKSILKKFSAYAFCILSDYIISAYAFCILSDYIISAYAFCILSDYIIMLLCHILYCTNVCLFCPRCMTSMPYVFVNIVNNCM